MNCCTGGEHQLTAVGQRNINRAINHWFCKPTLIAAAVSGAETVVSAAEAVVSAAERTVSVAETAVSATETLVYRPVDL